MSRRFILPLIGLGLFGILVTALIASRAGDPPEPMNLMDSSRVAIADDTESSADGIPAIAITEDRLRWGDALATLLARHVSSREQVNRITGAFSDQIDLRRVPAGATLRFGWRDSTLVHVEMDEPSGDAVVRVTLDPSGYRADRIVLPADTVLTWMHGEIESSVYESILAGGGNAELAIKFFEIFQFTHYFAVDTRRGDRFALITEEIRRDGERIGYGRVLAARYTGYFDTLTAVWRAAEDGGEYFAADGLSFRRDLLRVPFPAARITSTYGPRKHPVTGRVRVHHGIDLAADRGTPVVSAGKGTVTRVGRSHPGYGNWVHVRHGRTGFETRYGHFDRIARGIRVGSKVEQGTLIGYVGSTGLATGPHLHYEVFRDGRRLDPLRVKGSPVQKLTDSERIAFLQRDYLPMAYLLDEGESPLLTDASAPRLEVPGISPWPSLLADAFRAAP